MGTQNLLKFVQVRHGDGSMLYVEIERPEMIEQGHGFIVAETRLPHAAEEIAKQVREIFAAYAELELERVRGLLQRQWISVEERLPPLQELVLLANDGEFELGLRGLDGQEWFWCDADGLISEKFYEFGTEGSTVTHWQPIPTNFPQSSSLVSQGAESADIGKLDSVDECNCCEHSPCLCSAELGCNMKSGVEMGKVNRVEFDFVQVRELDGKFLVELENPQEIERGRGLILFRCDSQYAAQELSRQVKGILNAYCKFRRCGYSWSGRIVCELSSWHQGEHWTSHDGGFSFSSAKAGSAETGGEKAAWISVDERMPEDYGQFLVFATWLDGDGDAVYRVTEASWCMDDGWRVFASPIDAPPSHWMPIPCPPEVEEK